MLIALLACTTAADSSDSDAPIDAVDVTISDADLGELTDADIVLTGADALIEPGQDVMICLFGTYTGGDVGLHEIHTYQGAGGHHFQLMGTSTPAVDVPDGTVVDCTGENGGFQMASLEPLGLPNYGTVNGVLSDLAMPLPDGMAVELESGQRYVLQSHYLNTTQDTLHIGDKVVLHTLPTESVETWAAPLIFNRDDFSIPAGGSASVSFDCTIDADKEWNLLYMLGHMHEWGTAFQVDSMAGETATPVYSIPEWDPVYRDAPVILNFTDTVEPLVPGSVYRTSCSWFNDTDEAIGFPHEMCDTVSLVYPQKTTVICDGNGQ